MDLDVKLNVVTFMPDSICYIVGCLVFLFQHFSQAKIQETNNQATIKEPNKWPICYHTNMWKLVRILCGIICGGLETF